MNLNYYTKEWQTKFGYENRKARDRWQAEANKWLAEHVKITKE